MVITTFVLYAYIVVGYKTKIYWPWKAGCSALGCAHDISEHIHQLPSIDKYILTDANGLLKGVLYTENLDQNVS